MAKLVKFSATYNTTQKWSNPFNQVIFMNYDPVNPVYIANDIILPPGLQPGGAGTPVYPTMFKIALNQGDTGDDKDIYNLDFKKSTTAKLVIVYFQYRDK